jgi:3',5'-cyclic AMP phosphodiesterase CpdA
VSTRILHVSDLHMGAAEDPVVARALSDLVAETAPELVVASGDLTHRAHRSQQERAASLLRGLGPPVLAVPGNHDIPWAFPARFVRSFSEFERVWQTTQPVHRGEAIHAVGLNSVRPWRHQSGGVSGAQLEWAAAELAGAAGGALRVVVLHHHLIAPPWRSSRKRPVARRNHVLQTLVDSGAELILAGHVHQAAVSERREFEVVSADVRGVVVSIAPGLGQPRPKRLGEARGLHVYEAEPTQLTVATYTWRGDGWELTARRRFPRGLDPLRA